MKKFSFKLEKVLKLKTFREEECKIELGQAISALNLIENEIKKTAVKRHKAASERFKDPLEMPSWDNYILRLENEAEKLAEKAAKAEIVVDEKRDLYNEAYKEKKAIEILKEKRKEEYRKELMNYDMNEIDELTATRYNM
ncbi:MAG: flagellar export protein FliJ [Treponema sp.]|nr:flagellar export protein FliJ [Treponema sp.]